MPTFFEDRIFFQDGLQDLEQYLLSNELFWPLSGSRGMPRLTIGGLLLAGKRLQARSTAPAVQAVWAGMESRLEAVRSKWQAAWEQKAGREIHTRFDLWRNYLKDYQESPGDQADAYPHQVQWRVMLGLLQAGLSVTPPEIAGLDGLDQILKASWIPGAFVWEADLSPAFRENEYWYLYGKLKSS